MVDDKLKISMVTCFAFNGDHSKIALSPGNNTISIYSLPKIDSEMAKWTKLHSLEKHDSNVSSIDWSPTSDLIVTCGHDRNAYVWNFDKETQEWNPTLVILRINRAANWVQWNKNGTKFAVASSDKMVPVCRYEKTNNWWVSKMIKKHRSTVLSVCWHPNNIFLMTGCCDGKCRIFSAFIKELDEFDNEDEFSSIFPKQKSFGSLLAEIDCGTRWVESVCWSPNGMGGVFVSHDPAITFFNIDENAENKITSKKTELQNLPYRVVAFVDHEKVLAAGHDNNPHLYTIENGEWKFKEKIDKESGEKSGSKVSGFAASKALFQKSTTRGKFNSADTVLKTKHQNQIVGIRISKDMNAFFTAGLDGNVFYWKL